MTLGSGLQTAGWQVAIASEQPRIPNRHNVEWFTSHGFRHYEVPFPGPDTDIDAVKRAVQSAIQFRAVIADFRPDVIHVHYRATSIYAQAAQVLGGIPSVSTLHITPIPSGVLYRMVSFWGRRTIAISSDVREYLKTVFKLDESRIRTIHHGVDSDYFHPPTDTERSVARAELDVDNEPLVIAVLARMSHEKGHDVLFKALARLKDRGLRFCALLAGVSISGETEWRNRMMRLANDLGIADQVRFLGFTDARQVLWASDILVLPSRREGFPLAILEAMMSGLVPVRTVAAGAYDQIDDGETGFLIPIDDDEMLAKRIMLLGEDADCRKRMASAARDAAVARFSVRQMVDKTAELYNEVVRQSQRN